ncbi:hypothetical protein, partial [Pseudomonas sp. MAG002Y]|uniref:hypothetical protein n=1 Tax=Pseudomonas sp. MAG002Y TaxID=2678690 RepID=UPI001C609ADB
FPSSWLTSPPHPPTADGLNWLLSISACFDAALIFLHTFYPQHIRSKPTLGCLCQSGSNKKRRARLAFLLRCI